MKTVVISDLHGRNDWKQIYEVEKPQRMVFLGDYFDSYDIPSLVQQNNFLDIIAFKESGLCEVVLLIGNHDYHYFRELTEYCQTAGYQWGASTSIEFLMQDNKHHLQIAYKMENILFTHAGVSPVFMNQVFGEQGWKVENICELLNEMWRYKPLAFLFNPKNSLDDNGSSVTQGPLWIRPRYLMLAAKSIKKEIIQIVGHTVQDCIDIKSKSTGGRYYFTDVLGTSKEYLIIEKGKITCGKLTKKLI